MRRYKDVLLQKCFFRLFIEFERRSKSFCYRNDVSIYEKMEETIQSINGRFELSTYK